MPSQSVRFSADGEDYTRAVTLGTTFTVLCWARLAADRNNYTTIFGIDNGSDNPATALQTDTDGVSLGFANTPGTDIDPIHTMVVGTWYCYSFTRSALSGGTAVRVRYGTSPSSMTALTGVADGGLTTATFNRFHLGESGWTAEWLNGNIAFAKIYTRVLTDLEITTELSQYNPAGTTGLYAAWSFWDGPSTTDLSGNGRTLSGGTGTSAEAGPSGIPQVAAATITGTAVVTLPAPAVVATGTVVAEVVTGTAAVTLPAPTTTATGTVIAEVVTGAVAVVLPAPSVTAVGTVIAEVVTGTASVPLDAPTLAVLGVRTTSGTAAVSLSAPTLSATGTVVAEVVTGNAAVQLGALSVAASGSRTTLGTATIALPAVSLTVLGEGAVLPVTGTVAVPLPGLAVAAVGSRTVTGVVQLVLDVLAVEMVGTGHGWPPPASDVYAGELVAGGGLRAGEPSREVSIRS